MRKQDNNGQYPAGSPSADEPNDPNDITKILGMVISVLDWLKSAGKEGPELQCPSSCEMAAAVDRLKELTQRMNAQKLAELINDDCACIDVASHQSELVTDEDEDEEVKCYKCCHVGATPPRTPEPSLPPTPPVQNLSRTPSICFKCCHPEKTEDKSTTNDSLPPTPPVQNLSRTTSICFKCCHPEKTEDKSTPNNDTDVQDSIPAQRSSVGVSQSDTKRTIAETPMKEEKPDEIITKEARPASRASLVQSPSAPREYSSIHSRSNVYVDPQRIPSKTADPAAVIHRDISSQTGNYPPSREGITTGRSQPMTRTPSKLSACRPCPSSRKAAPRVPSTPPRAPSPPLNRKCSKCCNRLALDTNTQTSRTAMQPVGPPGRPPKRPSSCRSPELQKKPPVKKCVCASTQPSEILVRNRMNQYKIDTGEKTTQAAYHEIMYEQRKAVIDELLEPKDICRNLKERYKQDPQFKSTVKGVYRTLVVDGNDGEDDDDEDDDEEDDDDDDEEEADDYGCNASCPSSTATLQKVPDTMVTLPQVPDSPRSMTCPANRTTATPPAVPEISRGGCRGSLYRSLASSPSPHEMHEHSYQRPQQMAASTPYPQPGHAEPHKRYVTRAQCGPDPNSTFDPRTPPPVFSSHLYPTSKRAISPKNSFRSNEQAAIRSLTPQVGSHLPRIYRKLSDVHTPSGRSTRNDGTLKQSPPPIGIAAMRSGCNPSCPGSSTSAHRETVNEILCDNRTCDAVHPPEGFEFCTDGCMDQKIEAQQPHRKSKCLALCSKKSRTKRNASESQAMVDQLQSIPPCQRPPPPCARSPPPPPLPPRLSAPPLRTPPPLPKGAGPCNKSTCAAREQAKQVIVCGDDTCDSMYSPASEVFCRESCREDKLRMQAQPSDPERRNKCESSCPNMVKRKDASPERDKSDGQ